MCASYIMCHHMIVCDIVCHCMTLYVPQARFRSGLLDSPAKCMLNRNVMCDMYGSYEKKLLQCYGRSCVSEQVFPPSSRVGSQVIILKV